MKTLTLCLVLPILASLSACKSTEPSSTAMKGDGTAAPAPSAFYKEESNKGRLYVFGTQASHDNFEKSQSTPQVTKTFIGSGPTGETVVFEADAKSSDLQERLRKEFNRSHGMNLQ